MAKNACIVGQCCKCGHVCVKSLSAKINPPEFTELRYNPVIRLTPPGSTVLRHESVSSGMCSIPNSPKSPMKIETNFRNTFQAFERTPDKFRSSGPSECTCSQFSFRESYTNDTYTENDMFEYIGRSECLNTDNTEITNVGEVNYMHWGEAGRWVWLGGTDMNVYDLTAVGDSVVATDANKVKIYVIDPLNKSTSFGTPTWPRYGRGVTSTGDGKHFAVCHLNEICVYNLAGEVIQRLENENFSCCWGITCDNVGNYIVAESKRGVIYVIDPSGNLLRVIGSQNKKSGKTGVKLRLESRRADTSPETVVLSAPRYVATNYKQQIIVSDTGLKKVMVLNKDGTVAYELGSLAGKGCYLCKDEKEFTSSNFTRIEAKPLRVYSEVNLFKPGDVSTEKIVNRSKLRCCFASIARKLLRKSIKKRSSNAQQTVEQDKLFNTSYPSPNDNDSDDSNSSSISSETRSCDYCAIEDPRGICVDGFGNILVADKARHRVTLFDSDGGFVRHLLTHDNGIYEPRILCVINHTSLAVVDGTTKIKLFHFS